MKTYLLTPLLLLIGGLASATTLNFVPTGPVLAGSTFTVDVNADNSDAIAGFQFDVLFDPTILNATSAVGLGDFAGLSGYLSIDNIGGTIFTVFGVTSGGVVDSGNGIPLAELTFSAINNGNTTLTFDNYSIVDDPLTFDTEANPSANSLGVAVTPEPSTSTALLISGVAFLLTMRGRHSTRPEL